MIRLTRPARPARLTPETQAQLTATFIGSKAAVWNKVYIRLPLYNAARGKCAYCETPLGIGSPMEVDHFEPKGRAPAKVMDWYNMVPSCSACNGTKYNHDVLAEPIINPFDVDPGAHLEFKVCRLRGTTDLGRMSIDVLDLNERLKWAARSKVHMAIDEKVAQLLADLRDSPRPPTPALERGFTKLARAILQQAGPDTEYAALVATFLAHDPEWAEVKVLLARAELWTPQLETLAQTAAGLALPGR
jgi:HNH endonuclease